MGFLTPLFWVALAGAAIPVIIHLIQRENKNVVQFPSLMFLRRIPYQSVRRRRIRNWPLLLLRLAALALIVMAFTRPFLRTEALNAAASGGAREVVILLDRSYSLSLADRWARASALARDRVQQLGAADRASIVFFDTGAEVALRSTTDKGRLTSALAAGKPTAAATKYAPALKLAGSILSESALPHKEVVLISDFQRSAWLGAEGVRLPDGATVTPLSVAEGEAANVAITPAVLQRSTFDGQERVTVTAGAINRGPAIASLSLSLEVDGRTIQSKPVTLGEGGSASVTFDPFTPSSKFTRGAVRLPDDKLAADNAYHFVVTPRDRIKVILAGRPGAREGNLYLERALELGDTPSFDVVQRPVESISADDVSGAAVVVLNDVAVSPAIAARLGAFVENGGGLFFVLGPRAIWPGSPDILPVVPGQPADRSRGTPGRIGVVEYGHPIFETFRAPRSGDFSSARFYGYRSAVPSPDAQVLARFDDGAPALVERRVGRGKVVVWTSTFDVAWNDLALKPVFLPFVHRVGANLAAYTQRPASLTVGDVFSGREPGVKNEGRVALTPSGERLPLDDSTKGVVQLQEAGFYEVRSSEKDPAAMTVASNVDLTESDLTPIDPQDVSAGATGKAGGASAPGSNAVVTIEEQERAQRVWWYLLFAGLIVLGVETVLSNRMGHVRV